MAGLEIVEATTVHETINDKQHEEKDPPGRQDRKSALKHAATKPASHGHPDWHVRDEQVETKNGAFTSIDIDAGQIGGKRQAAFDPHGFANGVHIPEHTGGYGAEASSGVNGMPIVRSDSRDLKGLDSSSPLKAVSRVTGQPRKPNPALMQ